MHFWSKFGKPHFIWYWLIARTNSQAQNGVNFYFQVQFDFEDHRQSPHKTIGILINVFYISDPNLVILAWTVNELLHGQAHDWRTHGHTYTHTQATTIPKGQNWPRVKIKSGVRGDMWKLVSIIFQFPMPLHCNLVVIWSIVSQWLYTCFFDSSPLHPVLAEPVNPFSGDIH